MVTTHHHIAHDDLIAFARSYAQTLQSGDIVGLTGVIGTGKTTFLRVLLQVMGMDVDDGFTSPTFTILNCYELSQYNVNHLDLYRLEHFRELEQLDVFSGFAQTGTLTFIEWADKFSELDEMLTKKIHFEYCTQEPLKRNITCYAK